MESQISIKASQRCSFYHNIIKTDAILRLQTFIFTFIVLIYLNQIT